jgi:hypothetical protein
VRIHRYPFRLKVIYDLKQQRNCWLLPAIWREVLRFWRITPDTRLFINIGISWNTIITRSRQLKNITWLLLLSASKSLNDSLAPIPSVKYLHDRIEHKRIRKVVDESISRILPGLQLISNYLLQEMRKKKHVTSITLPQTRTSMISHQQMSLGDKSNVTITPPYNGVQYRKSEVVNEIQKYKKGSKEIGMTMMIMINMCYVPCGLHTLHCIMKIDDEGKPTNNTPWSTLSSKNQLLVLCWTSPRWVSQIEPPASSPH